MGFFEGVKGGEIVGRSNWRCEMGVDARVWVLRVYVGGFEKGAFTHF